MQFDILTERFALQLYCSEDFITVQFYCSAVASAVCCYNVLCIAQCSCGIAVLFSLQLILYDNAGCTSTV